MSDQFKRHWFAIRKTNYFADVWVIHGKLKAKALAVVYYDRLILAEANHV